MINYFYDYIKNIILFLIFTSFIQIILPSSKYRSYINLILGTILIFVMISPLNKMLGNLENIKTITIFKEDYKTNININSDKYLEVQNKMIKRAFEDNIKNQINTMLKDEYYVTNINISLYENKYKELFIEKIQLDIVYNNKNIYVEPFKESSNNIKDDKIKNLISNMYNLDDENIIINLK